MNELEIITAGVLALVLVVALAGLYVVSGRYVLRLRRALARTRRERDHARRDRDDAVAQREQATAALARVTGGTEEILRAVRDGEVPRG